jgi:hypothetical protein
MVEPCRLDGQSTIRWRHHQWVEDMSQPRDISELWSVRLARVRQSQARTDPSGMTRPPRDPDERAFLRRVGQEGPFKEAAPGGTEGSP